MGWMMEAEKRIFEFHSCAFHGCPRCYPNPEMMLPICSGRVGDVYQETLDRKKELENMAYQVEEIWECDLKRELKKKDSELAKKFKAVAWVEPLDPSDAFFGGKTNAIKLWYKVVD